MFYKRRGYDVHLPRKIDQKNMSTSPKKRKRIADHCSFPAVHVVRFSSSPAIGAWLPKSGISKGHGWAFQYWNQRVTWRLNPPLHRFLMVSISQWHCLFLVIWNYLPFCVASKSQCLVHIPMTPVVSKQGLPNSWSIWNALQINLDLRLASEYPNVWQKMRVFNYPSTGLPTSSFLNPNF